MVGNTAYVVSRAKSRRKKLADLPRMRQLINQSTDQLTSSVSNMGYSDEVNLYAGKLTGADLVEAALTHNLESELDDILSMCNGKIRSVIEIYTSRFEYQNAKVVLRSVVNDVSLEKVSNSILPDLNEVNTPWLKIIENFLQFFLECLNLSNSKNYPRRCYSETPITKLFHLDQWA